jgi:hypothetical protein
LPERVSAFEARERAAASHAPAAADGGAPPQGPPALDDETRTGGAGGNNGAEGEAEATSAEAPQADAPQADPLTNKGLPKRTPKITAPAHAPRQRTGSVDAEALRRRLGGFRQGAQAGYRDVAAEIAAHTEHTTGGTAEEASS